jgi:Ni,Fe-hydrogenase III small subunit
MCGIQPTSLTNEELIRHADLLLMQGMLPNDWQEEILKRLEQLVYPSTNAQ